MTRGSSRLARTFAGAREDGRPILIAYLCIGDPSVEASFLIAHALIEAGADILELGAPFSDPTADGPTIARAATRAIAAGGSMRAAVEVGARLRAQHGDVPLVLFGYANPVVVFGERQTVDACARAGIDALLVVDLPPEEGEELRDQARKARIDVIPLLTPTSVETRIHAAREVGSGFVYYVSVAGVTGQTANDPFDDAAVMAAKLRQSMSLPVVIGFGIDDADKARRACGNGVRDAGADGVVVGTAIVKAIEDAAGDVALARRNAAAVVERIRGEGATRGGA